MGQQAFIPNAGVGVSGGRSTFLTDLHNLAGDSVDYVSDNAGVFYTTQVSFTACVAFRVVQENTAGETIPILSALDDVGNGWQFFINPASKVCAQLNASSFIPSQCDLPLGRVIFAMLTIDVGGGEFYLNGRLMESNGTLSIPPVAPVTIRFGTSSWSKDFIEYIGFGYLERFLHSNISEDAPADLYMRFQDDGKISFPPSIAFGQPFAVYNASEGLANPAIFTPQPNSLGAPNLVAAPDGLPFGTLLEAPFHVAHSGWSDAP